jgi:hypothetical protein
MYATFVVCCIIVVELYGVLCMLLLYVCYVMRMIYGVCCIIPCAQIIRVCYNTQISVRVAVRQSPRRGTAPGRPLVSSAPASSPVGAGIVKDNCMFPVVFE